MKGRINEFLEKMEKKFFSYLYKGETPECGNGGLRFSPSLPSSLPIESLYGHQERAIDEISKGNHVILSIGTGGGKTEAAIGGIYVNEPMILQSDWICRAVFIYPTRALTEDQMTRLIKYFGQKNVTRFDSSNRKRNREASKRPILATNPAMLFTHLKYKTDLNNILSL